MDFCIDSPDPETTHRAAALLGRCIGVRGLAIGLVGPLGAGKTQFVKGLAEGLCLDPRLVSSPTFVIAQQYPLAAEGESLHHVDFYRLDSPSELEGLGFRDWLARGQVVAAEWSDRFPDALGEDCLTVVIERTGSAARAGVAPDDPDGEPRDDGRRRLSFHARGDESARVLADLVTRWARSAPGATRAGGSGTGVGASLVALWAAAGLFGWQLWWADLRAGVDGVGYPAAAAPAVGLAPAVPARAAASVARDAASVAEPFEREIERLLAGGKLDPNLASPRALENLPGLGPGRAAAIVAERERARFRDLVDLERVSGIGPGTRAKLEPFLAVDPGGGAG